MRFTEPPLTCPHCEEDFTESACPDCGWEYDGPSDEQMFAAVESAAATKAWHRDRERDMWSAVMRGD